MQFKVKAGSHTEAGHTYRKGDVVDSDNDLVAMFPEKFVLVEDSKERRSQGQPRTDTTKLVGTNVKDIGLTRKSGEPEEGESPIASGAQASESAKGVDGSSVPPAAGVTEAEDEQTEDEDGAASTKKTPSKKSKAAKKKTAADKWGDKE